MTTRTQNIDANIKEVQGTLVKSAKAKKEAELERSTLTSLINEVDKLVGKHAEQYTEQNSQFRQELVSELATQLVELNEEERNSLLYNISTASVIEEVKLNLKKHGIEVPKDADPLTIAAHEAIAAGLRRNLKDPKESLTVLKKMETPKKIEKAREKLREDIKQSTNKVLEKVKQTEEALDRIPGLDPLTETRVEQIYEDLSKQHKAEETEKQEEMMSFEGDL